MLKENFMRITKISMNLKKVCSLIANLSFKTASVAAGAISFWGGYQAKEPEIIWHKKNKRAKW